MPTELICALLWEDDETYTTFTKPEFGRDIATFDGRDAYVEEFDGGEQDPLYRVMSKRAHEKEYRPLSVRLAYSEDQAWANVVDAAGHDLPQWTSDDYAASFVFLDEPEFYFILGGGTRADWQKMLDMGVVEDRKVQPW
jgi:hypothetical protein